MAVRRPDRLIAAKGQRAVCRAQEAEWLAARHADQPLLTRMRRNGRAAFVAHLDVEGHPKGVAHALLKELAYILEEPNPYPPTSYAYTAGLNLPPPHLLREPKEELEEYNLPRCRRSCIDARESAQRRKVSLNASRM